MPLKLHSLFFSLLSIFFLPTRYLFGVAAPIGICYGRVADNLPPPSTIVSILKSNGISNVRLFDADPVTLQSFSGTGISLMIGVPNEILPSLAAGTVDSAVQWLQSAVFSHIPAAQIRYIAIGNEVFFKESYYASHLVPAILNLHQALKTLNLENTVKLSSPQAASVLSFSYPPSSGTFDPNLRSSMIPLLQFLSSTNSPFMINVYPYISYTNNLNHVSLDYALFGSQNPVRDGALTYSNLFDASVDAFAYAMEREGFGGIPVVVTETGWPTGGGAAASVENALLYNGNVARRIASDAGTPKRPGERMEVYLFGLFNEDKKGGEEYEKHFGIFGLDGSTVFNFSFN